ncbi:hypothetical protein [Cystobacter ferrugineus]|uniref:Secreted protein n=1 Tax=Cystobacter ferrugineus TaxID=83449 RepID=A0A1L9AY38_9BACT|nr:hypothetical protein [Cystobacter ferrugineus]OJH34896.1 hypothetical protein BON30_40615 [Cystobacter ferrugineus]
MNRRFTTLLSIPFLSLSVSTAALAAEEDNAPGAMCVGVGHDLRVNAQGQAENPQAVAVTAICPSERRLINGSFATRFSATVWVSDQSTQLSACCRAVSRVPNGASVVESPWSCTSTTGTSSNTQLTIQEITDGWTFAHFYIQCVVPPVEAGKTSRILTFRSTQS